MMKFIVTPGKENRKRTKTRRKEKKKNVDNVQWIIVIASNFGWKMSEFY